MKYHKLQLLDAGLFIDPDFIKVGNTLFGTYKDRDGNITSDLRSSKYWREGAIAEYPGGYSILTRNGHGLDWRRYEIS